MKPHPAARLCVYEAVENLTQASKDETLSAEERTKIVNAADDLSGLWADLRIKYEKEATK